MFRSKYSTVLLYNLVYQEHCKMYMKTKVCILKVRFTNVDQPGQNNGE